MAGIPDINRLYDCAQTLSAIKGDKAAEHTSEYETILKGVHGDTQSKRLASQFIARFSTQFPNLTDASLDAILDLCEDDDVNIRKQAIKDLPMMCRDRKDYLPKIADVLTQLLATDESSEVATIQNAIMTLFRRDCKGTLVGVFCQVKTGGDLVRDRALKFLHMKLKTGSKELLNKEGEIHLFEEIKACTFEGCTADEFKMLMNMLSLTSIPSNPAGKRMIVEMMGKMVDFEKSFAAEDEEAVNRLVKCYSAASDYFSDHVKSTKFCEYLCAKVLPEWDSILSDDQNMLLRILAELCEHTEKFEQPKEAVANIHTVLVEYLPQASSTDGVPDTFNPEKNLEFTKVECLLYAFHTVAQMSSFLTDNPELFKELQSRLQQFALGIQGYIRKLREVLHGKTTAQLMADENKDNAKALKSCTNINSLIKDLLIPTPTYKTKIGLSWKPVSKEALKRKSIQFKESPSDKSDNNQSKKKFAKTPIRVGGGGGGNRGSAGGAGVYAPPQGKYSSGLDSSMDGGRGGRRGGGGRFRGGRKK